MHGWTGSACPTPRAILSLLPKCQKFIRLPESSLPTATVLHCTASSSHVFNWSDSCRMNRCINSSNIPTNHWPLLLGTVYTLSWVRICMHYTASSRWEFARSSALVIGTRIMIACVKMVSAASHYSGVW